MNAAQTDIEFGTRVRVDGFARGNDEGWFMEYGDPRHSCSPEHISTPGMRIAFVMMDRYGKLPLWESSVTSLGARILA